MRELRYNELPPLVRLAVLEKDFLAGCQADDSDSVAVWVVNGESEKQKELLFSRARERFLSITERQECLPRKNLIIFPALGVKASIQYFLEDIAEVLSERIVFFVLESDRVVFDICRCYFSPFNGSVDVLVDLVVKKYNFSLSYKAFSREERINYWAGVFYQLRRCMSEFGASEDDVFDFSLIESMRALDSGFLFLLRDCLSRLSVIEQIDKDRLIGLLESRLNCELPRC